jgi:hypothetical protein
MEIFLNKKNFGGKKFTEQKSFFAEQKRFSRWKSSGLAKWTLKRHSNQETLRDPLSSYASPYASITPKVPGFDQFESELEAEILMEGSRDKKI